MSIIDEHIAGFRRSVLAEHVKQMPWNITLASAEIVRELLSRLSGDFLQKDGVAVHSSSIVENCAVVKAPAIIGPNCLISATAYIRGGCWLEANCIIGPGAELKSSFVFSGSKLAHFNFVGDSILGVDVNLEAGSVIANCRNEWEKPAISFMYMDRLLETGAEKFGALVGDRTKIGANAVIAPGAILAPRTIVKRLSIVDQGVRPL